jgi:hypothetical protein
MNINKPLTSFLSTKCCVIIRCSNEEYIRRKIRRNLIFKIIALALCSIFAVLSIIDYIYWSKQDRFFQIILLWIATIIALHRQDHELDIAILAFNPNSINEIKIQ